jgi:hypothetical protein
MEMLFGTYLFFVPPSRVQKYECSTVKKKKIKKLTGSLPRGKRPVPHMGEKGGYGGEREITCALIHRHPLWWE